MKSKLRRVSFGSVATLVFVLSWLAFLPGCKNAVEQQEQDHRPSAKTEAAEVSVENGQTIVTVDPATQKRLGLEIISLTPTVTREQVTVPAVVLSVQDLATLRTSYVATEAQLQKSRIDAGVNRKEYARLKTLFEENQNVSDKSLQSAEGALQASEAEVRTAEQQLALQRSVVQQQWGSTIADWVLRDSPDLHRVLDQRTVLVQITIPYTSTFGPPKTVSLEVQSGARTQANFVSTLPKVDPRIQGKSFLYLGPARAGIYPGLNLLAHLSVGSQMQGVVVPISAVVWSEGKAWIYREASPSRLTRQSVATDAPVDKGFFVRSGLSPGDRIVTQGAQALLSRESLIGGGENDEQ